MAAGGGPRRGRSSQDGADARHQFGGIERLGQIIVGAHFESANPVVRIAARGQHQHGGAGLLADAAQHFEAVGVGHHHVQHDERVVFGERPFDARRAARSPAISKPSRARKRVTSWHSSASSSTTSRRSMRKTPFILEHRSRAAVKICQALNPSRPILAFLDGSAAAALL